MKKDIVKREDIVRLVDAFYERVRKDDLLGPVFENEFQMNWEKHLPIMYDFWENVLFYTGNYSGNPMHTHQEANKKHKLNMQYFLRWNRLFNETVDDMFYGKNADTIKMKAHSIATIMQVKLYSN